MTQPGAEPLREGHGQRSVAARDPVSTFGPGGRRRQQYRPCPHRGGAPLLTWVTGETSKAMDILKAAERQEAVLPNHPNDELREDLARTWRQLGFLSSEIGNHAAAARSWRRMCELLEPLARSGAAPPWTLWRGRSTTWEYRLRERATWSRQRSSFIARRNSGTACSAARMIRCGGRPGRRGFQSCRAAHPEGRCARGSGAVGEGSHRAGAVGPRSATIVLPS